MSLGLKSKGSICNEEIIKLHDHDHDCDRFDAELPLPSVVVAIAIVLFSVVLLQAISVGPEALSCPAGIPS